MRTKIVATVGPACESPERLQALIQAGVDVFRLNFSHGSHDTHRTAFAHIRELAAALGANVCVLQDLQGPKIRTGALKDGGPVLLEAGRETAVTTRQIVGDAEKFATSYADLPRDVRPGDRILLDDGLIELRVRSTTDDTVHCEVVTGGPLAERKGINLPGVQVSAPALTAKDEADLRLGLELGVDAVALSFVRHAADIDAVRQLTRAAGPDAPIIAKIEKPEAVAEIDAILDAADAVMIARGDLGVEMDYEHVPVLQKRIITLANRLGKPVITATQMLESMVRHPSPTRAEASDVANAIFDGTDAVMLSAETAIGRYPLRAVEMMTRIAEAAEEVVQPQELPRPPGLRLSIPATVADAAVRAAADVGAAALVVFTMSGATARLLAQRRPPSPIHAFSPDPATCRRLALVWGVQAHPIPMAAASDALIEKAQAELLKLAAVQKGDIIVLVAGATPLPGATNALRVLEIG